MFSILGFCGFSARRIDYFWIKSEMEAATIAKGRYMYMHDVKKGLPEAIDVHHISFLNRHAWCLTSCTYVLVFAMTYIFISILMQGNTMAVLWSFFLAGFVLRHSHRKQVERESVTIFPAFGVQLETMYRSGNKVRHFVPIDQILKPVLNECVTPVSCYWSLSLIIRGADELLLVFKELYPPVSMLVPIWKALCAATIDEEFTSLHFDYGYSAAKTTIGC